MTQDHKNVAELPVTVSAENDNCLNSHNQKIDSY